jgi:uncharacterized protein YidB (DUF937 family)
MENTMGDILSGALGSLLGGGSNNHDNSVASIIQMVVNSQGGIGGLVEKFQQGGLGDMINSWISTGPNPPITHEQVGSVFSPDQISDLAKQMGGDHSAAMGAIAKYLPDIIDRLTPQGTLPQSNDWSSNIGGLLGGLLNK